MAPIGIDAISAVFNNQTRNGTNPDDIDDEESVFSGRTLYNKLFTYMTIGVFCMAFPLFSTLMCVLRKCCVPCKQFAVLFSRHCYIWMLVAAIIIVLINLIADIPVDIIWFFIPSHLFIFLETLNSKEWSLLKSIKYCKDVESYVETLTSSRPQVFLRQGDDDEFEYGSWEDFSKIHKLPSIKKNAVATCLELKQKIMLDSEAKDNLRKMQEEESEDECDGKGGNLDHTKIRCFKAVTRQKISKQIPGFKKSVLICHKDTKPFWMHRLFCFVMTVAFLGWPYRWFFKYRIKYVKFKLVKKISMFTNVYSMQVTDID